MKHRTEWRVIVRLRRKPKAGRVLDGKPVGGKTVASTVRIERPLDVVQAHFFDVDHHVRSNLFPGVRMAHMPVRSGGERRVRQEVVRAGIPQLSVFVVEAGADGEFVKRYVSGALKGIEWRARFVADGDGVTLVEARASVTASGLKRLTAPVRRRALKRTLDAALQAHKQDLESGYEPAPAI